ncbi:uncharacterized protein EDB91DRAFT_1251101 [Suillus paluster]|uniref:uncharacterized protein n=1 Tax=Suillus paluster TaxID=48578 RepID=UPI001B86E209|nr:uncharacterized protein EDB91DRAFT_1251101 [Suillus paluster]KAG1734056.1 hypothetical protein EDB91DRAFT_1251101 [Suillus paluster]
MAFDTHTYHIEHSSAHGYAASPHFSNARMWQHSSTGLEVVNESDLSPFIATIVGRVSPYCLKCTPSGNHFTGADHELSVDYLARVRNLEILQAEVGKTGNHKNMVIDDYTGKMIRFIKNIFTVCDRTIPDSPHGEAAENAPKMDDETKNWLIPDEFAHNFDGLKYSMAAEPLPLYHEGHLVEPRHANQIINGTIMEVQFSIQHWCITDFNSFQATAQKVTVLRLGPIHIPSNYKHANPEADLDEQPKMKKLRYNAEAGSSKDG